MRINGVARVSLLAAGLVSAASVAAVVARANVPGLDRYKPVQGFSYQLGSKRAVGFYTAADGQCRVTVMIAEAVGEDAVPPSAARVTLSMMPGQKAEVSSEEREAIDLTCGGSAAALFVGVTTSKPM